jgi:hypothetical protein
MFRLSRVVSIGVLLSCTRATTSLGSAIPHSATAWIDPPEDAEGLLRALLGFTGVSKSTLVGVPAQVATIDAWFRQVHRGAWWFNPAARARRPQTPEGQHRYEMAPALLPLFAV